jgi:hypothetical protein
MANINFCQADIIADFLFCQVSGVHWFVLQIDSSLPVNQLPIFPVPPSVLLAFKSIRF